MRKSVHKSMCLFLTTALALILCGCRSTSEASTTVNGYSGSIDNNMVVSVTDHHAPDAKQEVKFNEEFRSEDGTVLFNFDINEIVTAADMPVVEVVPHVLTKEDTHRIAQVLFGKSNFYELNPHREPVFSKEQIAKKTTLIAQYARIGMLGELYGEDRYDTELILDYLNELKQSYETALEENPLSLTQWKFSKGVSYQRMGRKMDSISDIVSNEELALDVAANDIHYIYNAAKRDEPTSKLNRITVYPYGGISPDNIDARIYYAELCRTEKPTDEQIGNAKQQAQAMLSEMGVGVWLVDQCYVGSSFFEQKNEYVINVDAVPTLQGVPAAKQDQFNGIGDSAASTYYLTEAHFEFSADGKLVEFELESPIDIVHTSNENVATLDLDTLLFHAKEQLMQRSSYDFGYGSMIDLIQDEELDCSVTIDSIEYNLIRVNLPDSVDSFYYVPGVVLSGNTEYHGKNSGELYYTYENNRTLLVLNAIDGAVIRTIDDVA